MKVVALGEIMMRLSNDSLREFTKSEKLDIYFGGGEYNTLVNLACLGYDTHIVTKLPDNKLGDRILHEAKAYNVNTKYVQKEQARLGTYYTILGNDVMPTEVIYDRLNSAFANSTYSDFDFKQILKDADVFHVSGITAALNDKTREMTLSAIKCAKQLGVKVSYDSNYRSKLWTQAEAGQFLEQILPLIDYAFLGILDINHLLKISSVNIKEGYQMLHVLYPNISYFASTDRTIISYSRHRLKVNIFNHKFYQSEEVEFEVRDRIGGGDVFTSGVLDGILKQKENEQIAKFALANTIIKHQRLGDNCYITRDEVKLVASGNNLKINR